MEEIEERTPIEGPDVEYETGRNTIQTIAIITVVLMALIMIVAVGYGLATHPQFTAVLRDISIIVLALVTVVIGLFLIVLIFQLQSLTVLLRDEIQPILKSVNQTAGTVRGTTIFVSDAVVSPMIKAAGYAAAVRQTFKSLTGSGRRKGQQGARSGGQPQGEQPGSLPE